MLILKKNLKEKFSLNENQSNLIVLASFTFVFQAVCFYIMNPEQFKFKWCFICFFVLFLYNIAYYKFFILEDA
jgi:hypothetical protein